MIRAFIGGLRAGGWGRVVLLASEDAVQPYPNELLYRAKAAVLSRPRQRLVERAGLVNGSDYRVDSGSVATI